MIKQKNRLLNIATPLLTLITQIRHTSKHHNVEKLRALVIDEINRFEKQLSSGSYSSRLIKAARYCLCAAIDESVLSRPWGTQSIWVQQSLLNLFHKENWGGERFYIILEAMAKEPRKNLDFLEFAYTLLSLGFEGKFFGTNLAIREEIRNRIFYRIRYSKEKPDKSLSRHWKDIKPITQQKQKRNKVKRISVLTGLILLVLVIFYNVSAYHKAQPLISKLQNIAKVSPITTFSEVIQRPIIDRGLN